jgi:hypothetical protein
LTGNYYLLVFLLNSEKMPPTPVEGEYAWGMVQEPVKLGDGPQKIIEKDVMLVPCGKDADGNGTGDACESCAIKNIQPSVIRIGFGLIPGLIPRIKRITLTANTDLEARGITSADLTIQNSPNYFNIISSVVSGNTINATILFWGMQGGSYNLNIGSCGSIPIVVSGYEHF